MIDKEEISSESAESPVRRSNTYSVALIGDTNSYTRQLSDALNALPGVDCVFYGPKKPLRGPTKGSVRFTGFKTYKPIWTERMYPFQIIKQSIQDRPDVLHIDFTITEFSSQYLNMMLFPLLVAALRVLRLNVVLTIHDVLSRDVLRELFGPSSFKAAFSHLGLIFYLRFLELSNTIIVHLEVLRNTLVAEFQINPEKIVLVPFGVAEIPRISQESRLQGWEGKFHERKVVLSFGVVAPRKGLEYVIRGFSMIAPRHPDSVLVLAGPRDTRHPKYLDDILDIATSRINPDQFFYAGYLDEANANSIISISRVVALSYLYACATTSVLYWIMSHAKPVIASSIDTLLEELDGYDESLFVKPKDSANIASALDRALSDDELTERATTYMESRASLHSWRHAAEGIVRAYSREPHMHHHSNLPAVVKHEPNIGEWREDFWEGTKF